MTSRSMHAGVSALLLGVTGLLGAAACSAPRETPAPPPAATQTPAPSASPSSAYSPQSQIAPDLPPLLANINRGARSPEVTRAVYEFAARHPEVLNYVPCFCGCERMGHKGNDSCFVGTRDKKGNVTEWETHGLVCEVCIDLAQMAMQMHNSGATVTEIRAAVDKRFTGYPTRTPTPTPPKGSKGH